MTIQEFPLAWRWTQPSHSVLPNEVLSRIRPLGPLEVIKVQNSDSAIQMPAVSCAAEDHAEVRTWLRDMQPDVQVLVHVIWGPDLAVETTWGIFTDYWDDFCYPSSDDVTVSPVVGSWQLVYDHEERFDFLTHS